MAEDLAAALQRGCGSYFREDDKLYYQASGLLQRAEAAAAAGGLLLLGRRRWWRALRMPQITLSLLFSLAKRTIRCLPLSPN